MQSSRPLRRCSRHRLKERSMLDSLQVLPADVHNHTLIANVHPPDWVNPEPAPRYNLVVIGAGTAGLITPAGAAGLGAKGAVIERNRMGGDCVNVRFLASKAPLRAVPANVRASAARVHGLDVSPV